MENKKSSELIPSPVGIGIMTLLTVILVIMLTVFSALTLITAQSDLELSERNAESVIAYYKADSQGVKGAEEFANGDGKELIQSIPITEMKNLDIHLVREENGSVSIKKWKTTIVEEIEIDESLDVWDGTISPLPQ